VNPRTASTGVSSPKRTTKTPRARTCFGSSPVTRPGCLGCWSRSMRSGPPQPVRRTASGARTRGVRREDKEWEGEQREARSDMVWRRLYEKRRTSAIEVV